jgi:hypothetical protein
MERTEDALPLRTQADLLGLSRASLSYQPVPPSPEEVAVKHRIDALYTARPFYGSRTLTVIVHEEGVLMNGNGCNAPCARWALRGSPLAPI